MSKRGSINARRFAPNTQGIKYGRRKWKKGPIESRLQGLCKVLNFDPVKKPEIYEQIKLEFTNLKTKKRREMSNNATLYKNYCKRKSLQVSLLDYLNQMKNNPSRELRLKWRK